MRLLRPLADQGNAHAENNLGLMYDTSRGVPQDYAAAVPWYRKAAEQGPARAQCRNDLASGPAARKGSPSAEWTRRKAQCCVPPAGLRRRASSG